MTKLCRRCNTTKAAAEFPKNKRYADGLGSYCKPCVAAAARASKAKHPPDPLYSIWAGIKQRCYNKNHKLYSNYGGRGVVMDEDWKDDFNKFKTYVDKLPKTGGKLVMINPNGNYTPGNIAWSTGNITIEYSGRKQTASEWAGELGINPSTLINRINRGWTTKRALETPVNSYSSKRQQLHGSK